MRLPFLARLALLTVLPITANAAINIDIQESGGDVVADASGSFDTASCTSVGPGSALALLFFDGSDTDVIVGSGAPTVDCLLTVTSPSSNLFNGNTNEAATTSSGNRVGFRAGASGIVFLPPSYVSNTPISGSATWSGQTYSSLNLNAGDFTYTAGSESITVNSGSTVGGTVLDLNGLGQSGSLTLQNNGAGDQILTTDGVFTFPPQPNGTDYDVTVSSQPAGQTCTVASGGTGTLVTSDITNVDVNCVFNTYTLGGTLTGLASGENVRLDVFSGGLLVDNRLFAADGIFTLATLPDLLTYSVTVGVQPTGQTCTVVSGGTVTLAGADVSNIAVACLDDPVAPPGGGPTTPARPVPVMPFWLLGLLGLTIAGFASRRLRRAL